MSADPLDDVYDELDSRLRIVEQRTASRKALGDHESDKRIDCSRCGQCLALRDTETGAVRVHYSGLRVRVVPKPGEAFTIACRRCGHDEDCAEPSH